MFNQLFVYPSGFKNACSAVHANNQQLHFEAIEAAIKLAAVI